MSLHHPARASLAAALFACGLGGCTTVSDSFTSSKIDYRSAAATPAPTLQVPPDLTQLGNDPRYQPPAGGAISANAMQTSEAAAPQAAGPSVAVRPSDDVRIERAGNQRWLVVRQTPEQVWDTLRTFWQDNGFTLVIDTPQVGVMETDWSENRAKLPTDIVSRTVGKVLDKLRDTGERDRYRTRIERNGSTTEIYISHRGVEQVGVERTGDSLRWQSRPSDPGLEAEMLARMMLRLTGTEDSSRSGNVKAVDAAVRSVGAAPATPPRARVVDQSTGTTLQIDDNLERSWRRVGLALDRSSFTVEERDRAQNVYLVRYVDPKLAGKEEPGFFSRVFSGARKEDLKGTRYQLKLTSDDGTSSSSLSILDDRGAAIVDEGARNIAQLLANELR